MRDADPEDEAGDEDGPVDGMGIARQAEAEAQQRKQAADPDRQQGDGGAQQQEVPFPRVPQRPSDRPGDEIVAQLGAGLRHHTAPAVLTRARYVMPGLVFRPAST